MKHIKQKPLFLLVCTVLSFVFPYIGGYFRWGGVPPGFGTFPPEKVMEAPPFHLPFFIFCCSVAVFMLLFLCFPWWFGFAKLPTPRATKKGPLPPWFYPGLIVTMLSWVLMWAPIPGLENLATFTFVPLWWGFVTVLDGIVYHRTGGRSLMANQPNTVKLLGAVSTVSWFLFEYFNYYVLNNWYYPNSHLLTNFGNISWQLVSYSTVLPAIFQWYWLLRTFPNLNIRYSKGPKMPVSKPMGYALLVLGFALFTVMGYFPHQLFWVLWLSLIPVLIPAMKVSGFWSPFTEIGKRGDWSYIILVALATVCNGFFWELWNYGSAYFRSGAPTNPNYWQYAIPYLEKGYFFSDMPILGYYGYLFFGMACWLLWLAAGYILGFDPKIHDEPIEQGG